MQLLRSEIHPAVRRTDPTPRQSALLEADQLHRQYDNGGVRIAGRLARERLENREPGDDRDRKSTRLNSSHSQISYAVFCLKKKKLDIFHLRSSSASRHRLRYRPSTSRPRLTLFGRLAITRLTQTHATVLRGDHARLMHVA